MPPTNRPPLDLAALGDAVLEGRRMMCPRRSRRRVHTRRDHREQAQQLLLRLLPPAGSAIRVGITGVPGVGKSDDHRSPRDAPDLVGHKVAGLAVASVLDPHRWLDPGDKTRMQPVGGTDALSASPTSGTLGGVAKATRETMVLLEAGRLRRILVGRSGVGRSEVTVANMVDTFHLPSRHPALGPHRCQLQGSRRCPRTRRHRQRQQCLRQARDRGALAPRELRAVLCGCLPARRAVEAARAHDERAREIVSTSFWAKCSGIGRSS
ncbi:hypothetical protein GS426_14335 [Rhodococcus hoagii]|nr:hypothetical protein [Prescottella equi]